MRYVLFLFFLQLFWASSYVAMKLAMVDMPIGLVLFFRYSIAFVALACLGGMRNWRFARRELLLLFGIGLLNFSLSPYLQLRALELTYATDVAVMVAFEPMISALLAILILHERLRWPTIATFVLSTIGVLVMSDVDTTEGFMTSIRLAGNTLFFFSLICEGVYTVSSRFFSKSHTPLQIITLATLAGLVGNVVLHFPTITIENIGAIRSQGWGAILYLSLGCSVFGYGGWTYLAQKLPIKELTLSLFLQPIIGGAVAYAILNEIPTINTFIGAAIIFSSLLFWTYWRVGRDDPQPSMVQNKVPVEGA
jgi:drug/metabolite transporter (DMT)-like permease